MEMSKKLSKILSKKTKTLEAEGNEILTKMKESDFLNDNKALSKIIKQQKKKKLRKRINHQIILGNNERKNVN